MRSNGENTGPGLWGGSPRRPRCACGMVTGEIAVRRFSVTSVAPATTPEAGVSAMNRNYGLRWQAQRDGAFG
ncbi:MAG TPA: hypothetical protein PLX89_09345, partial [Verrucomicrobiota bacterium]|nr:hypothetical protein [Verrucomicrobiota bacterium]